MVLDAASLEAITQEIRTCFLYEDAPDHLAVLEQGVRQLRANKDVAAIPVEYAALMRAAHSLKGGAGIAQFLTLSRLAHNLEDLLQALGQGLVPEQELACELLSLSVEQITNLIAVATNSPAGAINVADAEADLLPTLTALENFLQNLPSPYPNTHPNTQFTPNYANSTSAEQFTLASSDLDAISQEEAFSTPAAPGIRSLNLRMPVSRLDRMNNTIGELFISYERLLLYQEQLHQVDLILKKRADQLNPLSEQVQTIYDQLSITPSINNTIGVANLSDLGRKLLARQEFSESSRTHNTLQDLQELIVQVQEARSDVELISDEFRETLVELRQQLDELRGDLTESRLVRFGVLGRQFVAAQQTFTQRYNKLVEFVIVGKEILIDQVIVEQLKIPLLHLFRNAFDHGIENSEERLAQGKPPTAKITLAAAIAGNRIVITLGDDGRGIDLPSVYQRAVDLGLCNVAITQLAREQILEFLFQPGFSTSTTVTTLSGRGLGLDIVRLQVERLRGSVSVDTIPGQGTEFKISVPLTINILPLLLCKCQQKTLAIPATKVKEVIALSEYCGSLTPDRKISWRNQLIPLYSLIHILPYIQSTVGSLAQFNQYLGIVLEIDGEVVVLAVDSLLGERELVLKPFDLTVKIPDYILGCTVLGTGEVVPVLSPDHFGKLLAWAKTKPAVKQGGNSIGLQPRNGVAKILIVDDAIAFRRILERVLTQAGYQVIPCRDGKEALEKLNQPGEYFNLVLSDIEMPRVDGFALLREIRSHPQWRLLPVVMLTSRDNHWHRQTAISLGATDYFTKPFRTDELLNAIATLLPTI